jgi:hypothetical protein
MHRSCLGHTFFCWQECARTQACFVSTLPVACFIWPQHRQLKKLSAALLDAGNATFRVRYQNRLVPLIDYVRRKRCLRLVVSGLAYGYAFARDGILGNVIFRCSVPNPLVRYRNLVRGIREKRIRPTSPRLCPASSVGSFGIR